MLISFGEEYLPYLGILYPFSLIASERDKFDFIEKYIYLSVLIHRFVKQLL
jgi:hypothetical protein